MPNTNTGVELQSIAIRKMFFLFFGDFKMFNFGGVKQFQIQHSLDSGAMRSLASAILTVLVTVLAAVEVRTEGSTAWRLLVTGFGAFHGENLCHKIELSDLSDRFRNNRFSERFHG